MIIYLFKIQLLFLPLSFLINKIKQSQTTAAAFFSVALSLFYMYTLIKLILVTIRKQHPTVWVPMVCYIIWKLSLVILPLIIQNKNILVIKIYQHTDWCYIIILYSLIAAIYCNLSTLCTLVLTDSIKNSLYGQ